METAVAGARRTSVSKRLRYEVLRRDDYACRYCGARAPETALVVDHVVPAALGGRTEPGNLVAACEACNSGKASTSPEEPVVDDVRADALRWQRARARAAAEFAATEEGRHGLVQRFWDEVWSKYQYDDGSLVATSNDWRTSVARFLDEGLTLIDLQNLAGHAMSKPGLRGELSKWRYFCGACWKRVQEIDDRTRQLLEMEEAI